MVDKFKGRFFLIFICIMMSFSVPVQAAEESENTEQILFVLDASKSMEGDKWRDTVDVFEIISTMLPSSYETAAVVYNDEVVLCTGFSQPSGERLQSDELRSIVPGGYTNTGMALETALTQFPQEADGRKRIVVITDGEISMKEPSQTEEAVEMYEAAVKRAAEQDVVIDVLMLGTEDFEEQISYASEETGGYIYRESQPAGQFAETYLFDQLGLERVVVGTSDARSAAFHVSLQDVCSEQAKILVLSESPIEDIRVNCQSRDIQVFQAETAAVIELIQPAAAEIDLQYTLSEKGKISVYLVKEYRFFVDMAVSYSSDMLGHMIEVNVTDTKGNSVFEDENLKEKIEIYVDGSKAEYTVEQGRAVLVRQTEENQEVQIRVAFEKLDGIVLSSGEEKTLYLEMPPVEPEEDNSYIWLYMVTAGVCLAFVLSMLLLLRAKKKTGQPAKVPPEARGIGGTQRYDFSGQLVVYLLKNPAGEDMPPASVNLYLRESRQSFNFAWVWDKCHMDMPLKDADKLQFWGGAEHTLCVKNQGDVTVACGKEILLRNKKRILHYNEKLLLIFNDGETEMEVHYKNIKPSERER